MNILVTGCMGFIGSNLVPALLNDGHTVIGFDNLENPSINPTDRMKAASKFNWERFTFFKTDITDAANMTSFLCSQPKVDVIIHLAALGSVPRSFNKPPSTVFVNEFGFSTVFNLATNLKIKKVIFASSSSVYGANPEPYKVEGRAGPALSPYALSKKMNEELACIMGPITGTHFVGLRFFNVYGPGQRPDSIYSAVIPKFICEEKPQVYGDGTTMRDFTYVGDVAEAIKKAIAYEGRAAIVNVCTGVGTSLNELLDLLGKRESAIYLAPRPGDIHTSIGSINAAKDVLNFEATHTIKLGLDKTVKFFCELGIAKSAPKEVSDA